MLAGCSTSGALYVVPEHRDLEVPQQDGSDTVVAEFKIVNGLDQPVEVDRILPSCRCTAVELVDNPIMSGESTVLRATANLSGQVGRQKFSVLIVTDSSAFPFKRVSFTAVAPATGNRQRDFSLGVFYPGSEIDLQLPGDSFARGRIRSLQGASDGLRIATYLADGVNGKTMLVVKGTVPNTPGTFCRKVRFRESLPGKPSLGEGTVQVQLTGRVIGRWNVRRDMYCGFVSLHRDAGTVRLSLRRRLASMPDKQGKSVSKILATFSEEWVSLKSYAVSLNEIELGLEIHQEELGRVGAVSSAMKLVINYEDGDAESYSTNLFAHIDH